MEKKELINLLSELMFIKKISFVDNYICILFKRTIRGRWIKIFVKEIKVSFSKTKEYIFIDLESKNLLLEKIFNRFNKKIFDIIQFSVKQEKTKHGHRYVITIVRPDGLSYVKEKYPKIAEFFKIETCKEITWKIESSNINFVIK